MSTRKATDRLDGDEEEEVGTQVRGVDKKKMDKAWDMLEKAIPEEGVPVVLRNKKHQFYCGRNPIETVKDGHFTINIFSIEANVEEDDSSATIVLVQGKDGSFMVIDDSDVIRQESGQTSLTAREVDSLLDQIATAGIGEDGVQATQKETKDIIEEYGI